MTFTTLFWSVMIVVNATNLVVQRDANGRIHRSEAARREFMNSHQCPATSLIQLRCPGYIIDHINPLCKGGPDTPENMQWQTTAEAKAKDRVECK